MLDVLLPNIEAQLKSCSAYTNDAGNLVPGERLTEVAIMLRTKFRNYIQAVFEKLMENVSSLMQSTLCTLFLNNYLVEYFFEHFSAVVTHAV